MATPPSIRSVSGTRCQGEGSGRLAVVPLIVAVSDN